MSSVELRPYEERPGAGEQLRAFFRWWAGELRAAIPARWSAWWTSVERVAALDVSDTRAVIARPREGQLDPRATIDRSGAGDDAGRSRLAAALTEQDMAGWPVVVVLPAGRSVRREVNLPAAVSENLREAVEFEIERQTPFRADHVYFDARVLGPGAHGMVRVELTLAPRATVDDAVRAALSWGVAPAGASDAAALGELGQAAPNLLPEAQRAQPIEAPARWRWPLLGLFAVLLGAALALPIWQKRAQSIELMRMVDRSAESAHATMQLRKELERLTSQHNALLQRRQDQLPAGTTLAELSRLLPDDTYLTLLDLNGNRLELQGESSSAGRLVELMESSKAFRNAAFKSPLVRVPGVNADRFQLTAETRPVPRPTPPAADAAAPAPGQDASAAGSPTPQGMASPASPASPAAPAPAAAPAPGTPPASPRGEAKRP